MKKTLSLLALLGCCAAMLPPALAQADAAKPKATAKQTAKQPTRKKTAKAATAAAAGTAAAAATAHEDDVVPDVAGASGVDYQCALGAKVTLYENLPDAQHIAMRWGKDLRTLKRVDTSTGAQRFENKKHGLIWIGIPAKGMLLDSKKGQQLANDCKNPQQMMARPALPEQGGLLADRK